MVILQNNYAQHCSLKLKLSIYLWPYTKSYQTLDSEFESETKRLVYELLSWRNFSKIILLNPSYCLINTLKFTAKVKSLVTHQKLTKVNTARNQVKFKFSPSQRQKSKTSLLLKFDLWIYNICRCKTPLGRLMRCHSAN